MKIPPRRRGHVEEQISEAMARGEFENLKGQGQPLNIQGDLSDAKFAGQKLRHNAGFGAPWQDVAAEIDGLERNLQNAARRLETQRALTNAPNTTPKQREASVQIEAQLKREIEANVRAANSLILKYNLITPPLLPHLHRARLKPETYARD